MSVITRSSDERDVIIATLYGEARHESNDKALECIVWVIRNRAEKNKISWGGSQMKNVCLHPFQFECWQLNPLGIRLDDEAARERCTAIVDQVLNSSDDPSGGSHHYSRPKLHGYPDVDKISYPDWSKETIKMRRAGQFQFYRSIE